MSEVHTVLFDKKYHKPSDARIFLKDHGWKAIKKVHKTKNYLRYRLADPSKFKKFITKEITPSIKIVIGFYK